MKSPNEMNNDQPLSPQGHYELGLAYEYGMMMEKDLKNAFENFRLAAEKHHTAAQVKMGLWLLKGMNGVRKDIYVGFETLKTAAIKGFAQAANYVGECCEQGEGTSRNEQEAVIWYKKAADAGYVKALDNFIRCLENSIGIKRDEKTLKEYNTKRQTAIEDVYKMGKAHQMGQNCKPNIGVAILCLQNAADGNHAKAHFSLGCIYKNSQEIQPDYEKAIHHFEMAGKLGEGDSYYHLGLIYDEGKGGIQRDPKKAFEYYNHPSIRDTAVGMEKLVHCYKEGEGVTKDTKKSDELALILSQHYYHQAMELTMKKPKDPKAVAADPKAPASNPNAAASPAANNAAANTAAFDPRAAERAKRSLLMASKFGNDAAKDKIAEDDATLAMLLQAKEEYENRKYETPEDMVRWGDFFMNDPQQFSIERAVKCYKDAASRNHAPAMLILGRMHESGAAVPFLVLDAKMAFDYYQKAAALNDKTAMDEVARCYLTGFGVEKNPVKGSSIDKTSKAGELYNQAFMFENGTNGKTPDIKNAVELYIQASELGHVEASYHLGQIYYFGSALSPKDLDKALKYYLRAAKGQHPRALVCIADLYRNKESSVYDISMAIKFYEMAIKKNNEDREAYNNLGEIYEQGLLDGKPDYHVAFEYYKQAAADSKNVNVKAWINLYFCHKKGLGTDVNEKEANEYKEKIGEHFYQLAMACYNKHDDKLALQNFAYAVDWENVEALKFMAVAYAQGNLVKRDLKKANLLAHRLADLYFKQAEELMKGTPADQKKAIEAYQQAAECNHAEALYVLAVCYRDGKAGVAVDYAKAMLHMTLAANLGLRDAQYYVGHYNEHGLGLDKPNPETAVEYYKAAASQNHPEAMVSLGNCFENGIGMRQNHQMAVQSYRNAVNLNFAPALNRLALCYRHGIGVELSRVGEAENFALAAALGNHEYQKRFAQLQAIFPIRDHVVNLFYQWGLEPSRTYSNLVTDFVYETAEDQIIAKEWMENLYRKEEEDLFDLVELGIELGMSRKSAKSSSAANSAVNNSAASISTASNAASISTPSNSNSAVSSMSAANNNPASSVASAIFMPSMSVVASTANNSAVSAVYIPSISTASVVNSAAITINISVAADAANNSVVSAADNSAAKNNIAPK